MEVRGFVLVFLYLPLDRVKRQVLHPSPSLESIWQELVELCCWGCCSRRRELRRAAVPQHTHAWIPSLVMPVLHH